MSRRPNQIRVLYHVFRNLNFPTQPVNNKTTSSSTPSGQQRHSLFTSYTLSTYAPLLEIDYNLHKSNSTYFTDLDISRAIIIARHIIPGLRHISETVSTHPDKEARKPGQMSVILGAVHCGFRKKIGPYTRYEVRSRLVGWDRKWFFICSHFVKGTSNKDPVLLASAFSKYVVKKGRWTIPPEEILKAGGFLPKLINEKREEVDVERNISTTARKRKIEFGECSEKEGMDERGGWGWERLEQERQSGLKLTKDFASVDEILTDAFDKFPWT